MSSFNRYYQSELSALRTLGRRFSERNPALAPFLGESGSDPDVERLFEGFAFLTGRLRERLDDELPELTHSLMQLLWPNYMRPLPAFSVLEFDPLPLAAPALEVPRHSPVESRDVDGVRCRFRTCYPTEVLPLALNALSYSTKGDRSLLSLQLNMTGEGHLGQLDLKRLRLHLAGERYISQMLYLNFSRHLEGISLVLLGRDRQALLDNGGMPLAFSLPVQSMMPVGFAEDEALIPYPLNTFRGYRLLQEYFSFKEKFLFVDLLGLEALKQFPDDILANVRGLEMRFTIKAADETRELRPTLENIRLYCTPIVNLFPHDGLPLQLDGKQDEYLLLPAEYESGQCGVYSVDRMTGWRAGGLGYRDFVPFESFEHDSHCDLGQSVAHYTLRQRPSLAHDGLDTYVRFSREGVLLAETLSTELTCTNQNLPQHLSVGDICHAGSGLPESLSFRNITPASRFYPPPLGQGMLWKLISNMSLNYLSLANITALRKVLETYDFASHHDPRAQEVSQQRLAGLKSIRHQAADRLYGGLPLRGLRTELTMDPQHYAGEGDLFLFATVLNEFFALYVGLNSFHELNVLSAKGEVYKWTPRLGQQPLF
ncbi:type VI secretion system baseplate subunit TssF [Pseudomonas chlororaphis]|nr:type VI secretion system baseplate subunit TssF [Pseudomonas chlororaphis]